jgi:Uma2 family endonuclease
VKNFQEHPQSILLTDSILPKLREVQPDNQFAIGQDCGIYWRLTEPSEPLYKGAEAPDWFYVANVPPMLDGVCRRSYVMWQEHVAPLIALEFVSGDGSEERDKTPYQGKFWVYEQAIQIPYYGIYEVNKASIEMYHLVSGHYELMLPNQYGQYEIPELDAAIGIWRGEYNNVTLPWMRWWDRQGNLLPTSEEQLEIERQAKELAQQELAELRAKLRDLGIDLG